MTSCEDGVEDHLQQCTVVFNPVAHLLRRLNEVSLASQLSQIALRGLIIKIIFLVLSNPPLKTKSKSLTIQNESLWTVSDLDLVFNGGCDKN